MCAFAPTLVCAHVLSDLVMAEYITIMLINSKTAGKLIRCPFCACDLFLSLLPEQITAELIDCM
jgi:hypothetical protein